MTASRFDVVVVGAGPAGSNAALQLARRGARVALLERQALPRYKTCGGGLVPRALAELPATVRLDVERRCATIELSVQGLTAPFVVKQEQPLVVMTMRAALDHALARAAADAGADLRDSVSVCGIEDRGDTVALRTSAGNMLADHVVAADGATGPIARWAGWPGRLAGIPALEWEIEVDASTFERYRGAARFDLGYPDDGYAWLFPKREHLSIGAMRIGRGAGLLHAGLKRYREQLGLHRTLHAETHGYVIPLRPREELSRGRIHLVGDAAGLADPVTAEGISHALISGRVLAQAWEQSGGDAGSLARCYAEALREMLAELRMARRLAWLLYRRPALRGMLFRRHGQRLCDAIVDVIRGRRSYRELALNPRNYLRLIGSASGQ